MEEWVVEDRKRKEIYRFFLYWKYQWFGSMNMADDKNHSYAEERLKKWRKLFHKQGIDIAYNGLYISVPHPHVHLLMIGYDKMGHSLFYANKEKWEKEWAKLTIGQEAVIEWINDSEAVTEYVALKNTVPGKYEMLTPQNMNLLKRYKLK